MSSRRPPSTRQLRIKSMRLELDHLFKSLEYGNAKFEDCQYRINQLIDQIEEFEKVSDRMPPLESASDGPTRSNVIHGLFQHIIQGMADGGGLSIIAETGQTNEDVPVPLPKSCMERIEKRQVTQEESKKHRCVICMEDCETNQTIMVLPCDHIYHEACVTKHFQTKPTCPMCRKDVRDFLEPASLGSSSGSGSDESSDDEEQESQNIVNTVSNVLQSCIEELHRDTTE